MKNTRSRVNWHYVDFSLIFSLSVQSSCDQCYFSLDCLIVCAHSTQSTVPAHMYAAVTRLEIRNASNRLDPWPLDFYGLAFMWKRLLVEHDSTIQI